jgi:hypothetical protein
VGKENEDRNAKECFFTNGCSIIKEKNQKTTDTKPFNGRQKKLIRGALEPLFFQSILKIGVPGH